MGSDLNPYRKNFLHCLKYFAAQNVNKELFRIFFQKIQKLISGDGGGWGGGGGGLNKSRGGGGGRLFGRLEYMACGKAG